MVRGAAVAAARERVVAVRSSRVRLAALRKSMLCGVNLPEGTILQNVAYKESAPLPLWTWGAVPFTARRPVTAYTGFTPPRPGYRVYRVYRVYRLHVYQRRY